MHTVLMLKVAIVAQVARFGGHILNSSVQQSENLDNTTGSHLVTKQAQTIRPVRCVIL